MDCCGKKKDKRGKNDEEDNLNDPMTGKASEQKGFSARSSLIHKLIDVGLLAANVSQLKVILSSDLGQFHHLTMVLVILSICVQVAFLLCMIAVWYLEDKLERYVAEKRDADQDAQTNTDGANPGIHVVRSDQQNTLSIKMKNQRSQLTKLNVAGYILVALIIVLNIFITGFGLNEQSKNTENVGETKYVAIVNGSIKVLN